MRKDGPGIMGIQANTPGIKILKAKVGTRFQRNKEFIIEAKTDSTNENFTKATENNQPNLIMTPALQKQQARCENEIKRLDDLIKDAKAKGDDDSVARFEAQKELYQQQIEDCQKKIEEEQANALDSKNGLAGNKTDVEALRQADEAANLEAERQELLEKLDAAEKQEKAKTTEPNFNV